MRISNNAIIFALACLVSVPAVTALTIPKSTGEVSEKDAITVKKGQVFDGKNKRFNRAGVDCTGQKEGGNKDAMFLLEDGATLRNVIIGPNQIEGVHCLGACRIENVFWEKVCEDALTLKGPGDAVVIGGGAKGAEDKVIQHNGPGSVSVDGFEADGFGKLYRSCGNCGTQFPRKSSFSNIVAANGKLLAGINENLGDTISFKNIKMTAVKDGCVNFKGVTSGEPSEVGPCTAAKGLAGAQT